jgi:hypothetical protein
MTMKIRIMLIGPGGELDRQYLDLHEDDDSAEISTAIVAALEAWTLAPGDTITIKEVRHA